MVLDFCSGGELFFHISKNKRFHEMSAKYYFAELVLAIEHLHDHNIVYRDLKPENVLIDDDGHIRITDFGLAKPNFYPASTSDSFCGSPEYMSPEMLKQHAHGRAVDFYSMGAILYEMLTGLPPFYHTDRRVLYRNILKQELRFPSFVSSQAQSLISALLNRESS